MASEDLSIDGNSRNIAGAVTDDSNQFTKRLRIDDTTKGLKVMIIGGTGTGTVTSISQGTGIVATPNPIIATGSIALSVPLQPIATLGTALQSIRVNAGATALEYYTPSSGGLTIGTTTITSGTTTRILYDNAGVVGEYTITGTGTVVAMQTSPTFNTSITVAGVIIDATDINVSTNNLLMISTNNTNRWQFSATGHFLAATDNTYDIGASGATRPRTIYAGTSVIINGGTALVSGGALGTPSSGTGTNITGIPAANILAGTFGTGVYTLNNLIYANNAIAAAANAATVPITFRVNTVTNSSAATLTITMTTTSAVDGQIVEVRILDFSGVAQTLTFVNTENSTVTVPATSNGSTTLPLSVLFQFNANTTKWRCIASA